MDRTTGKPGPTALWCAGLAVRSRPRWKQHSGELVTPYGNRVAQIAHTHFVLTWKSTGLLRGARMSRSDQGKSPLLLPSRRWMNPARSWFTFSPLGVGSFVPLRLVAGPRKNRFCRCWRSFGSVDSGPRDLDQTIVNALGDAMSVFIFRTNHDHDVEPGADDRCFSASFKVTPLKAWTGERSTSDLTSRPCL